MCIEKTLTQNIMQHAGLKSLGVHSAAASVPSQQPCHSLGLPAEQRSVPGDAPEPMQPGRTWLSTAE